MTLDEITQAAKIAGILKDENVEPMPQTFDPALRKFVPSLSDQGSKRVVLYGPDGQPISTVEGKLAVRAEEIETAISTLQTALAGAGVDAKTLADVVTALDGKSTEAKQDAANTLLTALKGKDYATQTTLAQVLAKMIAAPATEAKQDALAEKIDGILDGTTPATTQLTGSNVAYDSTHDAIKTVNASLLHESFDFKNTKEVTVSPGSYLVDTFRPTNGYAMLRIITKRIGAAHNWRLCANWSSDGTQVYQVVEKLHTATSGDADTQTAKIVTPVGSQWVMLQLFNDDAENSHSYHVHMMLTAG